MVYVQYSFIVLEQTVANFLHLHRITLYRLVNLAECNVLIKCLLQPLGCILNKVPEHGTILHEHSLVVIGIPCDMHRV